MKYLLILLMLTGVAYAQEPPYTPMKGNYRFKGIKVDSLFLIPSFADTTTANATNLDSISGAFIRTGNDFWMRNAELTGWLQNVNVGPGSSPVTSFVSSIYRKANTDSIKYIINPSDTIFAYKDRGFDTLRRSNDSIYAYRWGTKVFQYKDSSGSSYPGDSPNRINGNATSNISANMKRKSFIIDSAWFYSLQTKSISGPYYYSGEILLNDAACSINSYDINGLTSGFSYDMWGSNVSITNKSNVAWISKREFIEDTLAMLGDLTLQKVLDNNHDLVDGNNFQGTGAGVGNTGIDVNAFGFDACRDNSGNDVNAFGNKAGKENTFSYVNLFGPEAKATAINQLVLSDSIGLQTRINFGAENQDREFTLPPTVDGTIKLTSYTKINLGSTAYTATKPGVYLNEGGYTYTFTFPDVDLMLGQTISIWNTGGGNVNLATINGDPVQPDFTFITMVANNRMQTFTAFPKYWVLTSDQ